MHCLKDISPPKEGSSSLVHPIGAIAKVILFDSFLILILIIPLNY